MSLPKLLIVILATVILVGGGYFGLDKLGLFGQTVTKFEADSYQAVFLSNNQVYFGKVTNLNNNYVQLTDIYYLILKSPLQKQTPEEGSAPAKPEYTLVKLGNELHGPKDEMWINRDSILFIEDLKADSKVASTIRDAASEGEGVIEGEE